MSKYSHFFVKLFYISVSLIIIVISSKQIISEKSKEYELNNNFITTAFNNNLVDSVKFKDGKYRMFLSDEDIKSVKYSKHKISENSLKLLNRMSFQDVPSTSKSYIMNNLENIVYYQYVGDNIYYFKLGGAVESVDLDDDNIEFKVIDTFSEIEEKAIKKCVRKNNFLKFKFKINNL